MGAIHDNDLAARQGAFSILNQDQRNAIYRPRETRPRHAQLRDPQRRHRRWQVRRTPFERPIRWIGLSGLQHCESKARPAALRHARGSAVTPGRTPAAAALVTSTPGKSTIETPRSRGRCRAHPPRPPRGYRRLRHRRAPSHALGLRDRVSRAAAPRRCRGCRAAIVHGGARAARDLRRHPPVRALVRTRRPEPRAQRPSQPRPALAPPLGAWPSSSSRRPRPPRRIAAPKTRRSAPASASR